MSINCFFLTTLHSTVFENENLQVFVMIVEMNAAVTSRINLKHVPKERHSRKKNLHLIRLAYVRHGFNFRKVNSETNLDLIILFPTQICIRVSLKVFEVFFQNSFTDFR